MSRPQPHAVAPPEKMIATRMSLIPIQRLKSRFRRLWAGNGTQDASTGLEKGIRIYAIGDIHGRLDLLLRLSELIVLDRKNSPPGSSLAIFLGDYIDRGPASEGVLQRLISGPQICD